MSKVFLLGYAGLAAVVGIMLQDAPLSVPTQATRPPITISSNKIQREILRCQRECREDYLPPVYVEKFNVLRGDAVADTPADGTTPQEIAEAAAGILIDGLPEYPGLITDEDK